MARDTKEMWFLVGMWWRIIYGVLRIFLSLALLQVVGIPLIDVATTILRRELLEDPSDRLYSGIHYVLLNHSLEVTYFLAFYFMFWGIVDIILSYNLIKHRLWAFPFSLLLMVGFVFYEIYRCTYTHSPILLGIMCVDAVIIWLVWNEYKKLTGKNVVEAVLE